MPFASAPATAARKPSWIRSNYPDYLNYPEFPIQFDVSPIRAPQGALFLWRTTQESQQGGRGTFFGFVAPLKWSPCHVCNSLSIRRLPRRSDIHLFCLPAFGDQPCRRSLRSCRRKRSPSPQMRLLTSFEKAALCCEKRGCTQAASGRRGRAGHKWSFDGRREEPVFCRLESLPRCVVQAQRV